MLQPKTYWSILETFYDDKKIPLIPPLLVDNKLTTSYKTKANVWNEYFAEQCALLKKSRILSINQTFLTQSKINSLDFNEKEILKIIRALNIHKVHGHDDIFIRMIEICGKSFLKPLILLFQNSAKLSYFSDIWTRSIF